MEAIYDSLNRKGRIPPAYKAWTTFWGTANTAFNTPGQMISVLCPTPMEKTTSVYLFYQDGELLISIPVLPLKRGDDPYRIQKRLGSQYRKYRKLREEREAAWATAQARYDSAYAVYESQVKATSITRKPAAPNAVSVTRIFNVNTTGSFNSSSIYTYNQPAYASVKQARSKTGEAIQLRRAWLVDMQHNGVRTIDAEHFVYDRNGHFTLVGEIDANTLAVLSEGDFRQAVSIDDQNLDIRMKIIPVTNRPIREIIDELGL